jgi:hypothetical protein
VEKEKREQEDQIMNARETAITEMDEKRIMLTKRWIKVIDDIKQNFSIYNIEQTACEKLMKQVPGQIDIT